MESNIKSIQLIPVIIAAQTWFNMVKLTWLGGFFAYLTEKILEFS